MEIVSEEFSVGIHPLAIAAICDHHTRVVSGGTRFSVTAPVIGLIFGTRQGKNVSIFDATDVLYTSTTPDDIDLISTEVKLKTRLWVEVYPGYELLGWYTTGTHLKAVHIAIHKSLASMQINPSFSPLFLLLDPYQVIDPATFNPSTASLPLTIYNSSFAETSSPSDFFHDVTSPSSPTSSSSSSSLAFHTNPSESLAIEQVLRSLPPPSPSSTTSSSGASSSVLTPHTLSLLSSLSVLDHNISLLLDSLSSSPSNPSNPSSSSTSSSSSTFSGEGKGEIEDRSKGEGGRSTNSQEYLRSVSHLCSLLPPLSTSSSFSSSSSLDESFSSSLLSSHLLTSLSLLSSRTSEVYEYRQDLEHQIRYKEMQEMIGGGGGREGREGLGGGGISGMMMRGRMGMGGGGGKERERERMMKMGMRTNAGAGAGGGGAGGGGMDLFGGMRGMGKARGLR